MNDVKPKNLLKFGDNCWKWIDFDCARQTGQPVPGFSPKTCSPEIVRASLKNSRHSGYGPSMPASDIFRLVKNRFSSAKSFTDILIVCLVLML